MAVRPSPAAPFTAPITGELNQRLAVVAAAINRKADATATPSFSAITLRAPDGSSWTLSVDATGTLVTTQVPA
jgi:hypothetical protein